MITIIVLLIISLHKSSHLNFNLEPNEKICLDEHFSDKTLIIFEIHSNSTVNLRIRNPNQDIIYNQEDQNKHKHSITTSKGGYFETCIQNKNKNDSANINFILKHGVAAKDYSTIAKAKDLLPLELDVKNFLQIILVIKIRREINRNRTIP